MKIKSLLFVLAISIHLLSWAQVAKEQVVIEKFTGIYCGACPTAVHNIHDLEENENANVLVVSYHSAGPYSDPLFENADSDGRNSYYSSLITGYPTVVFDGVSVPDFSQGYDAYVDSYNARKDLESPVSVDLSYIWNGGNSYTLTATITRESTITSGDLRLQVALTETNIDFAWKGEEKLYDVVRDMLPNYNGTSLDFSTEDVLTFDMDFSLDADWDPDYCQLVAFVQDHSSREIFQAKAVSIANITETADARPDMISGIADNHCGSSLAPQVRIRNSSGTALTDLDIHYSVNGGTEAIHHWTGNLAPFEQVNVDLPEISFTQQTLDNELLIRTSQPNGVADEDISNDEITHSFDASPMIGTTPSIEFRTDEWPFLNNWELLDASGAVVAQSGSLSSYTVYTENFDLTDGCYTFKMYDQTGNGFVNWAGDDGYIIFYDDLGNEMENVVDFGFELSINFEVSSTVSISEDKDSLTELKLFPNPAQNHIRIESNHNIQAYQLTNSLGQVLLSESEIDLKEKHLDLSQLSSGVYLLQVRTASGISTQNIQILR